MPNTGRSGRQADPGALVSLVLGVVGAGVLVVAGALAFTTWADGVGGGTTAPPPGPTAPLPDPTIPLDVDLVVVTDDSGRLEIAVPVAWSDLGTGAWTRSGVEVGVSLLASPDRQAWVESWGIPGVFVGASDIVAFDDALGDFSGSCTLVTTEPYWLGDLPGVAEWWADCGVERSDFVVAVVTDGATVVLVQLVTVAGDPPGLARGVLATLRHHQ